MFHSGSSAEKHSDRPPPEPKKAQRLADARFADSPVASAAHMPVPGVAAKVDEEAVPSFRDWRRRYGAAFLMTTAIDHDGLSLLPLLFDARR